MIAKLLVIARFGAMLLAAIYEIALLTGVCLGLAYGLTKLMS